MDDGNTGIERLQQGNRRIEEFGTLVFGVGSNDYLAKAYDGLKSVQNLVIVPAASGLEGGFRKVHLSRKINQHIRLPLQHLWAMNDLSRVAPISFDPRLMLLLESREARSAGYVSCLRKRHPHSFICLNLLNPLSWKNTEQWVNEVEGCYDAIVTCSREDAEKHNWLYWPDCYSPSPLNCDIADVDICFIAQGKGRESAAWAYYQAAKNLGLKCDFVLTGTSMRVGSSDGFRVSSKAMTYEEYLAHIARAKCLLEIGADGSNHCTLRTMEALSYGKILATTNANIVKEPFYDPDQICVLRSIEQVRELSTMIRKYENPFASKAAYFAPERLISQLRRMSCENVEL